MYAFKHNIGIEKVVLKSKLSLSAHQFTDYFLTKTNIGKEVISKLSLLEL